MVLNRKSNFLIGVTVNKPLSIEYIANMNDVLRKQIMMGGRRLADLMV